MQATLTALGGQVSPNSVTVSTGSVTSDAIVVTPNEGQTEVTISVGDATFGGSYSDVEYGDHAKLNAGESLTLEFVGGV